MSSIPTAEELLLEIMACLKMDYSLEELNDNDTSLVPYLLEKINDRTKLHVQAALEAAGEIANEWENSGELKPEILDAYSLENIK